MIRQLTADEQHSLDFVVDQVYTGHVVEALLPGWMSPEAFKRYVGEKLARLNRKVAEPILDDVEGDAAWEAKRVRMPYGWSFGESGDVSTDAAVARIYYEEGRR